MTKLTEWKYAVKDIQEVYDKGCWCRYYIIVDGKDMFTGKSENEFLKNGYTILTENQFHEAEKVHEDSLCGKWVEISEETYEDRLNALPPLRWYDGGFFLREAWTGDVHGFCQQLGDKYYESCQRLSTPRCDILQDLKDKIAKCEVKEMMSIN